MKTKRKPQKLLSLLLCCVMLVGMMPMATGTAFAENSKPAATAVSVDGKSFNTGRLYYKNKDADKNFTGSESDYNAYYNPDDGVLTLKDYEGGTSQLAERRQQTLQLI